MRTHASQEKLTEEEAAAHIEVIPGDYSLTNRSQLTLLYTNTITGIGDHSHLYFFSL